MYKKAEIEKIMRELFEIRKEELDKVPYGSKSRAFVVAGIDLVYNYMCDVLEKLEEDKS